MIVGIGRQGEMRLGHVFVGFLMLGGTALGAENLDRSLGNDFFSGAAPSQSRYIVAQECGYFAILGCFRQQHDAENWNDQVIGGRVVDTSSLRYPSFRSGYYCVVHGPTSQTRARSIMLGWKRFIPDAYIKDSCQ